MLWQRMVLVALQRLHEVSHTEVQLQSVQATSLAWDLSVIILSHTLQHSIDHVLLPSPAVSTVATGEGTKRNCGM